MFCLAAKEAEVLVKMVFAFFIGELAIFAEFGGEVRRHLWTGGGGVGLGFQVQSLLVIGVGTGTGLALVIGMVVLDLGVFSSYFRASFPIMSINGLDEGLEVGEVVGFAYMGNLVLDSGGKSIVELLSEHGVTPLYLSCKVVEFDEVFGDMLVVMHLEILDFCFSLPFRFVRSEVRLELGDEFIVVIEPIGCQVGE